MKKLSFLAFLFVPVHLWAAHPSLITTSSRFAAIKSSATAHPWSDMQASATNFIASPLGVYGFVNGSPLGDSHDLMDQMVDLMNANSVMYAISAPSSATYRNNIKGMLDNLDALWTLSRSQYCANPVATGFGYTCASPLSSAFFSATLALDLVHDDLSASDISNYETIIGSFTNWTKTGASSWVLGNDGAAAVIRVYFSSAPALVAIATAAYHNDLFYVSGGQNSELNDQGGDGGGTEYPWARVGGDAVEKMAKWGFKYVAEFTGVDASYYNSLLSATYQWISTALVNPFGYETVFGDTSNDFATGLNYWAGINNSSYTLANIDVTAGKFNATAAANFGHLVSKTSRPLDYPHDLISYVNATGAITNGTVSSYVLAHNGAALWDNDTSTTTLMGVLWNARTTQWGHTHREQNNMYLAGYGQPLLTGPGYCPQGNGPILQFPESWCHDNAVSANTVLIGNQNHSTNLAANGIDPTTGGDGITESILTTYFDYASGYSTTSYAGMGTDDRNFVLVHSTDVANGYWIVSDEIHSSTYSFVNVLWHPYTATYTTTTLNFEYAWPITGHPLTSTTTLNIFLASPPSAVTFSSGAFSAPTAFYSTYLNSKYSLDTSSNSRVVTILYPSDATHNKSTFTRLSSGDATGASILSGSTTDYVLTSSGTTSIIANGITFQGKMAFFRVIASAVQQFFVRQGISFDNKVLPRTGFSSNLPVSFYMLGASGKIFPQASSSVTFYYPGINGVNIDSVAVGGVQGSNAYTITISSGNHDFAFSIGNISPSTTSVLLKGNVSLKGRVNFK